MSVMSAKMETLKGSQTAPEPSSMHAGGCLTHEPTAPPPSGDDHGVAETGGSRSVWTQPLTQLVRTIEERRYKIVGLASDRANAGVSLVTREMAASYRCFGRRAILADVKAKADDWVASGGQLAKSPEFQSYFRDSFVAGQSSGDVVLVDLPPAVTSQGWPDPVFMAAGAACDAVFLVCLVGEMTRADVALFMDNARIGQIAVAGLLLNDHRIPMSWLLGRS